MNDRPAFLGSEALAEQASARPALQLYAGVLAAGSLRPAAHRLVASLAEARGYSRVSIGLRNGAHTELLAVSNLDLATPQAELPQLLLGAMDEALEQTQTLVEPEPDAKLPYIRLEHQALRRRVGGTIATVPLAAGGELIGAVCLERSDGRPIDAVERRQVENQLQLAAPLLHLMQQNEQPWHRRARRSLRKGWLALRQPDQRRKRQLLAGALAAFALLALAPLEHEVGGRARLEGAEQRVLMAPSDGFLKTAHARPGDRVRSGEPLVDLTDRDLNLERERLSSQLAQSENAYAAAMGKSDRAQASISMARMSEAQAQLALVDEQLARGRITAPFDGIVIEGDLSQSIGAPVRQGDPLVTVAATGRYRVIVEVDELDIDHVAAGQHGTLVLSSAGWHAEDIVVERITPLAKAVDGRNVFEVQAALLQADERLRPGLQGRARIVVGRLPPLWAWTGQALDRLRLSLWSWLG